MCCDPKGLFDVVHKSTEVKIANGKTVKSPHWGKCRAIMTVKRNGRICREEILLLKVLFVPDMDVNVLSVKVIEQNCKSVMFKEHSVFIERKDGSRIQILCEQDFKSLCTVKLNVIEENKRVVTRDEAHMMGAHSHRRTAELTAQDQEWILVGDKKGCSDCFEAKGAQKKVNKHAEHTSAKKGERFCIDTAPLKHPTLGGHNNALAALDDCTDNKWLFLLKTKDELSDTMIAFIKELKGLGITVKCIRLDNAGENIAFAKNAKALGLGLKFEFTPTRSPQHNGKVERWTATMLGRVRAILNQGKITSKSDRAKFAGELMHTVTKVENVLVKEKGETSSYEKFWGKKAPHAKNLRIPLEMGVVSNLKKIKAKLDNRGQKMMFLGYAEDHAGDVFRFWNPKTRKVIVSRDVRWTNVIVNHTEPVNNRRMILKALTRTDADQEASVEDPSEDENNSSSNGDSDGDSSDSETSAKEKHRDIRRVHTVVNEETKQPEAEHEEDESSSSGSSDDEEGKEECESRAPSPDTEANNDSAEEDESTTVGGQENEPSRRVTRSMAPDSRPRELRNLDMNMNGTAAAT